jgi:PHD-finger/Phytanoyl-CoA dioxygenase (PhyH)
MPFCLHSRTEPSCGLADFYHLSEASDLYYPGKTSMAAAGGKTATSKSGPVAADSDDDSQSESPESPVDCPKCGPKRPADQFLMCDECNTVCHMKCLVPPLKSVPEGDWYCDDCMPRPLIMTSWIPLTDVGAEHGGLCILVGSHEYGGLDEEGKIPYSQVCVQFAFLLCCGLMI